MTIDASEKVNVSGIVMQGSKSSKTELVSEVKIAYSDDESDWKEV
jgi:hypothetical protein